MLMEFNLKPKRFKKGNEKKKKKIKENHFENRSEKEIESKFSFDSIQKKESFATGAWP